jgi:hypothetical protein
LFRVSIPVAELFVFCCFAFLLLPFYLLFLPEAKKSSASIIGATCGFDAKIYKIVGGIFNVSACGTGDKKLFKNSDFCSALPSLLVENSVKNNK